MTKNRTIKRIILGLIFVILLGVIIFLYYGGVFSKIIVEEKEVGPFLIAYEDQMNDYVKTAKKQKEICEFLSHNYGLQVYRGFSVFYSNPREVEKAALRSITGCILERADYKKADFLRENNFRIKEVPLQVSLLVEFPYKNYFLTRIVMSKANFMIEKYVRENNLSNNERMLIYDMAEEEIIFLMRK